MNKTFITSFFIVFGIGMYLMIGLDDHHYPPEPIITVDDKNLEVARGSYCWHSVCVDTMSPPMLIDHHRLEPMIVPPASKLIIKFEEEPIANTVKVNRWLNDHDVEEVALTNDILIAPQESGIYVYDVHARWEKGTASYAFTIEVRSIIPRLTAGRCTTVYPKLSGR